MGAHAGAQRADARWAGRPRAATAWLQLERLPSAVLACCGSGSRHRKVAREGSARPAGPPACLPRLHPQAPPSPAPPPGRRAEPRGAGGAVRAGRQGLQGPCRHAPGRPAGRAGQDGPAQHGWAGGRAGRARGCLATAVAAAAGRRGRVAEGRGAPLCNFGATLCRPPALLPGPGWAKRCPLLRSPSAVVPLGARSRLDVLDLESARYVVPGTARFQEPAPPASGASGWVRRVHGASRSLSRGMMLCFRACLHKAGLAPAV